MIVKQLSDVYKHREVDGESQEYLFRKNVVTRRFIDSSSRISAVDELLTGKGTPYKTRCMITLDTGEQLVVKHSFEEIIKYKQPNKIRGFYGRE